MLVGPSGSGKSTVLRLIAGLETPTSGRILIDGEDVTAVPPQRRDLAMVFQSYALYPHKSVRENLAFGLRMRKVPMPDIETRCNRTAEMLGIEALLDRQPAQLSGGQRQRVAVGRAMARDARVSCSTNRSRISTRCCASKRAPNWRCCIVGSAATMMYVTHDQEEAMTLGTRIAVMRDGALEQVGTPMALYREPANRFVASFVGAPAINVCRGECARVDGRWVVRAPILKGDLVLPGAREPMPQHVDVGFRPQDIELCAVADADVVATVAVVEALGAVTLLHVRVDGVPDALVRLVVPPDVEVQPDDRIAFRIRRDRLHLFDSDGGGGRLQ